MQLQLPLLPVVVASCWCHSIVLLKLLHLLQAVLRVLWLLLLREGKEAPCCIGLRMITAFSTHMCAVSKALLPILQKGVDIAVHAGELG